MANRIVHFDISANDAGRAKKFYEDAFGWEIKKWESDDMEGMSYYLVKTGPKEEMGINGGMVLRSENPKTGQEKGFTCTVGVSDIDEAIEKVKAAGGKITMEKMEMKGVGWFAAAEDTEGNFINLMQASPDMPEM
jgi:uncharacterized protein